MQNHNNWFQKSICFCGYIITVIITKSQSVLDRNNQKKINARFNSNLTSIKAIK